MEILKDILAIVIIIVMIFLLSMVAGFKALFLATSICLIVMWAIWRIVERW